MGNETSGLFAARFDWDSRGPWYAKKCSLDQSPPLLELRARMESDTACAYFDRCLSFCKIYQPTGQLLPCWGAVARFVRWPGTGDEMRDLFRDCGLVDPSRQDELFGWETSNAWIIRKQEAERRRAIENRKKKRKAGKASGKARRAKAKLRALKPR